MLVFGFFSLPLEHSKTCNSGGFEYLMKPKFVCEALACFVIYCRCYDVKTRFMLFLFHSIRIPGSCNSRSTHFRPTIQIDFNITPLIFCKTLILLECRWDFPMCANFFSQYKFLWSYTVRDFIPKV